MTTLQPYPDYKDSGIRWLGEVPTHWTKVSIGTISQLINGFPFDSSLFDPNDGTPLIRIRDLNSSSTSVRYRGQVVESALVKTGDLIIGMDGDFNVALWRGEHALLNQRMCSLHPKTQTDVRFLAYLLPTPLQQINDQTHATTVKHLSSGQVRSIRVCSPPLDEQRAIADYLDAMDAKITRFIAARRRMIVLLEEQKGAIINQAITRGLDPDVPLKPSGIDWLGDIPAHWQVRRLKHSAVINPSKSESPMVDSTEQVPFVPMERLGTDGTIDGSLRRLHQEVRNGFTYFKEQDVLLAKITPCFENGKAGIAVGLEGGFGYGSTEYHVLRAQDVLTPQHLYHVVSSKWFRAIGVDFMEGSAGQKRVPTDFVDNFPLPLPPLDEQCAIANFLDAETERVAQVMLRTRRELERIQEYRTRLISDVVTGKLDVRGVELSAVEEIDGGRFGLESVDVTLKEKVPT